MTNKTIKQRFQELQGRKKDARDRAQMVLSQLIRIESEPDPTVNNNIDEMINRASRIFQLDNQCVVMYLFEGRIEFFTRPHKDSRETQTKIFSLGFDLNRVGDTFRVEFYLQKVDSRERMSIEIVDDDPVHVLNAHASRTLFDFLS